MTRIAQKRNTAARTAFTDKYGSCAIEAGLVGNLADHECRHGFLRSDPKRNCSCHPASVKVGKR